MAIRKFRKKIKPFIWVMTIAFLLSMGAVTISELKRNTMSERKDAFKLNEKEVSKVEIERMKNNISGSLSQQSEEKIDEEVIETIAIDEVIKGTLLEQYGEKLKIKVPNSEVKKEYKKVEEEVGKENLSRMLSYRGHTKNSFKKELKKNLLMSKTIKKITESSEDEKNVEKRLEILRKEMIISEVDNNYTDSVPKVVLSSEEFTMMNGEYDKKVLFSLLTNGKGLESAKAEVKKIFEENVLLSKVAKEKGVKVEEGISLDSTFSEYFEGLKEKVGNEIVIDEEELIEYFKENKENYDKVATVDFEVAKLELKGTEEEKNNIKIKMEETLEKLKKEEIKFESLKDIEPTIVFMDKFVEIKKDSYLSNVGEVQKELVEKVFINKVGDIELLIGKEEALFYRKNLATDKKDASLSDTEIKDVVQSDYKNERITREIEMLKTKNQII